MLNNKNPSDLLDFSIINIMSGVQTLKLISDWEHWWWREDYSDEYKDRVRAAARKIEEAITELCNSHH